MIAPAADFGGYADDPWQRARRAHQRKMALVPERVATLQYHRDVEGLVEDARKRVRRIQPQRRQHGHHLVLEISLQPATLARTPALVGEDVDLFGVELGTDLVLPGGVDLGDQVQHAAADPGQQFARRDAVWPGRGRAIGMVMLEHRYPHLEELIEVVRHDAQIPYALKQRHAGVAGHRQHAEIKLQRCQLAAEVQLRGAEIDGRRQAGGRSGHAPFWPMARAKYIARHSAFSAERSRCGVTRSAARLLLALCRHRSTAVRRRTYPAPTAGVRPGCPQFRSCVCAIPTAVASVR